PWASFAAERASRLMSSAVGLCAMVMSFHRRLVTVDGQTVTGSGLFPHCSKIFASAERERAW
ncbi:hypothetical protein ACNF5F_27580, partial [Escherichia coli]|uniref:hypothetical protein n=1 Tax=Escherichia coli TaxID=562 RepID=UPI003BA26367